MSSVVQWFLAVVFAGAAVGKLTDREQFVTTLVALRSLSVTQARLLARAIPAVEVMIVALLVSLPRVGAIGALAALGLFTAVIVRELAGGGDFRCGCFGAAHARPSGKGALARNAILAGAASALLITPESPHVGAALIGAAIGLLLLVVEVGGEAIRPERAP